MGVNYDIHCKYHVIILCQMTFCKGYAWRNIMVFCVCKNLLFVYNYQY